MNVFLRYQAVDQNRLAARLQAAPRGSDQSPSLPAPVWRQLAAATAWAAAARSEAVQGTPQVRSALGGISSAPGVAFGTSGPQLRRRTFAAASAPVGAEYARRMPQNVEVTMQAVPPPQPPLPLRWAEAVRNVEAAQQVRFSGVCATHRKAVQRV